MSKFIPETPNFLIYIGAILRPKSLRPHLRVPSKFSHSSDSDLRITRWCHAGVEELMIDINHVDFNALKRAGYNAVVIDKDNCLVRPRLRSS
jgi:phosphatidylglycerophosphatase GEP4